jgi:hypothetical protein
MGHHLDQVMLYGHVLAVNDRLVEKMLKWEGRSDGTESNCSKRLVGAMTWNFGYGREKTSIPLSL